MLRITRCEVWLYPGVHCDYGVGANGSSLYKHTKRSTDVLMWHLCGKIITHSSTWERTGSKYWNQSSTEKVNSRNSIGSKYRGQ